MVTIHIPIPLRRFTQDQAEVALSLTAATISSLLSRLDVHCPGIQSQICAPDGLIKRYINVFVNGQDIRSLSGEQTLVADQDEVHIIPAMAGG